MLEGGGPLLISDSDNTHFIENSCSSLASGVCNALKIKWLAQIATSRQQVSKLMQKILIEEPLPETFQSHYASVKVPPPLFKIFDRMRLQQKSLLSTVSNLSLTAKDDLSEIEERESALKSHTDPTFIPRLKEKGYSSLADKLDSHDNYPWTEFKKFRIPVLIEQLVDIHLLCEQKKLENENTEKIIDFSLYLVNLASTSNSDNLSASSEEIIENTKQVLGQLIYLINNDPAITIECLNKADSQEILNSLRDAFNEKIQEICEALQDHYLAHATTQLQDPDTALQTRIPIEIGKALLTEIGTINVGIIDLLSSIFLSPETYQINSAINLSHALNLLQRSPKLRSEFEKIAPPKSTKTPSNEVIKASLGLSLESEIGEFDARLVALIAVLSHLRQGTDRSCFATSLAIEILSSHLNFCFKDLGQLLKEGKLSRRVKGVKKDIPFSKQINDPILYKEIFFNHRGELLINHETKAPLWESPGLQAACQAIGIKDPKTTILNTIENLPPLCEKEFHQMNIRTLILKICQASLSLDSSTSNLNDRFAQASFAFSSQTTQPLLKVWENSIANMAEAEEGSMIKTAILSSTLDALQFRLGQLSIPPSLCLQRYFLSIQKLLYERIHLQYDPVVNHTAKEGEESAEGGFILYNRQEKIQEITSFREFLHDILESVDSSICKQGCSEIEIQNFNQAEQILLHHLYSNEFMIYLLARYHPSNKIIIDQFSHESSIDYSTIPFTPWLSAIGNNSKTILKIYLESEKPIQSEKFINRSAEEALTNIIDMCKQMPLEEKKLFLRNPNKLKPLSITGKHRLPFMPGNPSLTKAWMQDSSTREWIEEFVIHPGRVIGETLIDIDTRNNLLHHLKEIFHTECSKELLILFFERIEKIPLSLTIKEYRDRIISLYLHLNPSSPSTLGKKIIRKIDTALCNSLPLLMKHTLENSAIHFADTNWSEELQDIHFCFAINPGSGQLELWQVHSDGSHLTAIDQNYWLFNQKWEFLTMPSDLMPDDSSLLDLD